MSKPQNQQPSSPPPTEEDNRKFLEQLGLASALSMKPADEAKPAEGDGNEEEPPKEEDTLVIPEANLTLSERVALRKQREAAAKEPKEPEEEEEPEEKEGEGEEEPPEEKPEEEPAKPKPSLKKKEPKPAEPPKVPELEEEEEPPKKEDESAGPQIDPEFLEGLPQEYRDEVELAMFAETHDPGYKGFTNRIVEYIKKISELEAGEDGVDEDELESLKKKQPSYKPGDYKRFERQMIRESAVKEAEERVNKRFEDQQRKLREIELRPKIDQSVKEFESRFEQEAKDLPEGVEPIDPDVVKEIKTLPPQEAEAKYPIEAPIYRYASNAARLFKELTTGVQAFDFDNQSHQQIINFLDSEGLNFMNSGESTTRGGKQFLTQTKYSQVYAKNPKAAEEKYWTFSEDEVLDRLYKFAHSRAHQEQKRLEAAGWVRQRPSKKKEAKEAKEPEKEEKVERKSPKATPSRSPGAADKSNKPKKDEFFWQGLGVEPPE